MGPGTSNFLLPPSSPYPPRPILILTTLPMFQRNTYLICFTQSFCFTVNITLLRGKKTKQYEIYPSWKWLISTVALFSLKWPCVAVWCCKIVASLVLFPRFSKLIDAPFLLCQKSKTDWIAHTKHISCVWFHRLILILIKGSVTVRHVCAYLFTIFICTFQLWNPFYMIVQVFKT